MLTKRIVPCLDIKDGKVVKGINFKQLQTVGDPIELAKKYDLEGADEIVFLDISASREGRKTMLDVITKAASELSIPLVVGGGMKTLEDVRNTLLAGADKVSLNSFAVENPELITVCARTFGAQCVVGAVDACWNEARQGWDVYVKGGKEKTDLDLIEWVKKLEALGAGEILLTSMDADGTKQGFDLRMLQEVCAAINIPVIASGGCGSAKDIVEVFEETNVDAALAASIFHYGEVTIAETKQALKDAKIPVRVVK